MVYDVNEGLMNIDLGPACRCMSRTTIRMISKLSHGKTARNAHVSGSECAYGLVSWQIEAFRDCDQLVASLR